MLVQVSNRLPESYIFYLKILHIITFISGTLQFFIISNTQIYIYGLINDWETKLF